MEQDIPSGTAQGSDKGNTEVKSESPNKTVRAFDCGPDPGRDAVGERSCRNRPRPAPGGLRCRAGRPLAGRLERVEAESTWQLRWTHCPLGGASGEGLGSGSGSPGKRLDSMRQGSPGRT